MKVTYCNAIQRALADEMSNDESVVLFGEDIQKNLYGYTGELFDRFGGRRVINIPLSEASVTGLVCGAAMCGIRPVLDLTIPNFMYVAMDQIANIAAKTHYMYNGDYILPLTIFCSGMAGSGNAAQHSDRLHSLFINIPGLKVICPASVQDAYSMLCGAIRDDNPVICFFDRSLFWREDDINLKGEIDISRAKVVKSGKDLLIISISACTDMIKNLLPDLYAKGIDCELIDIRTAQPLDFNTIRESVRRIGKVIICDTANRTGSVASEISSLIAQYEFASLKAPIYIIAGEDVPVPFAKVLEEQIILTKDKLRKQILEYVEKFC